MSEDPMYGPNVHAPSEDDELSYPLGGSESTIAEQLAKLEHHDEHDKAERRQHRSPKDRMLKLPRRNR